VVNNSPTIEVQNNVKGPKRQIDFDKHIRGFWNKFINYVKSGNVTLGQCLQDGVPTNYENEVLTITFKYDKEFQLNVCKKDLMQLEEALQMCYKTPIRVKFALFPKPNDEPIQSEDDAVRVAPPDLSGGAPIIEEAPPEDTNISQDNESPLGGLRGAEATHGGAVDRDLEVIDSVTIDNSALTSIDREANNVPLSDSLGGGSCEATDGGMELGATTTSDRAVNEPPLESKDEDNNESEPVSVVPEDDILKDDINSQEDSEVTVDNNISDPIENKETVDSVVEPEEQPTEQEQAKDIDVLADSPLMDQQYTDHPKLEEVLSLFPDAVVETIRNK